MKRFYGGIVALLLAGNVLAQTATQTAVPAALRGLTTAEHRAGGFSGCILVQQQNKPVWDTCIGLPDASFTVDQALFPLASISKAVTASLVMRAHAYGELDLNTPLTAYLPGLLPKKWGKRITPYHLLTHTSGLPAPEALPEQETTLARYLTQFLTEDQPYQKPGRFQYNDLDYVLLDTLLEQQTRTQFWQLLVQELWLNSDFKLELFTDDYLPDSLAAFVVPPADGPLNAQERAYLRLARAASGLYGTAADLAAFDELLRDTSFLSTEALQQMYTPYQPAAYAAMGSWVYPSPYVPSRTQTVERRGGLFGYSHVFYRFPAHELCIVMLSNTDAFETDTFGQPDSFKERFIRTTLEGLLN